ncbi:oligopeptide ABC transporter substrate-binding protein [uncultured Granulicatella sp.]|uniref:oligopeptide ABC transporter substrate-binding protein n=1 Tax=uncultured Granulicatella sp. TaxID=316089 RepID=UPI002613022C|nr:oligopeptide ABC transporter substrate-binding protein [uncultured Granulicatella sp.]
MKKKSLLFLSAAAAAVTLAACGNANNGNSGNTSSEPAKASSKSKFNAEVTHEGTAIKGGTLKYALVAASPFSGIFIDELSTNSTDSTIASQVDLSMFEYDENRKLTNTGLASLELDVEGKTATVKLNAKDYKWSDGQPFTIDDYIFAIEAIGNKDYTGSRYNDRYQNIVGMKDFHEGKSDKISGVEKVDDYTVKIHFEKMLPSMQLAGGAIPAYTMPKHIFKDIPVKDWEQSEYVRGTKVVGLGPFTIESIVPGESVTLKANENFYKGRPKVDKMVMQVVSPDSIVSEMKAGNYDIASMPSAQYEAFKDLTNVTFLSSFAPSYEYISFKLGTFDKSQGKNVTNPKAKMSDPALRQAIGYALDIDSAGENLYHGLNYGTNSIILPFFKDVYNKEQEGFTYNPEKAKQLLDEAGYKDVDGDGIRENKDGSKLTINFAARTRDAANESLIQQYLIWWKEIGLDVQLYTGRTIESNNFYVKIQADDPEIDMFAGGWGTGYDPNPSNLFGETAKFNFARYVNEKGTEIMKKISSTDAFDDAKNKEFYKEWQAYAKDEAFMIPTLVGDSVTAVNKRVKYYDTSIATSGSKSQVYQIELTSEDGAK